MPDEDDLERRVRKLAIEHAETRWLALRFDEIRDELRAVQAVQTEHIARFDSIDGQLRSLTLYKDQRRLALLEWGYAAGELSPGNAS